MIKDSEVWTWGEKTASVVALASLKMCGVHTVGSTLMPYLKCMKGGLREARCILETVSYLLMFSRKSLIPARLSMRSAQFMIPS